MASRRFTLAVTFLAALCACRPGKGDPVPDALVGSWVTPAAKYADRYFEISREAVGFGTGDYNVEVYPVVGLEASLKDRRVFYDFSLRTPEGDPYRFAFYYEPTDGGKIQFEHQEEITWTKERAQQ